MIKKWLIKLIDSRIEAWYVKKMAEIYARGEKELWTTKEADRVKARASIDELMKGFGV